MARFDTSGFDDLIDDIAAMGDEADEMVDEMLMASAEEVKIAWQKAAEMHDLKDTGDMIASIGYPRKPKKIGDVKEIDIYPQGKDRKGQRNAEKAFILHFGTVSAKAQARRKKKKYSGPGIPATHWVDDADDIAGPRVEARMRDIYDKRLQKHGL